ncbi:MAG: hypothetical protein QM809_03690 [Gordonia sp. (in: high G+C Gram-positive bacteria)]|uniref:hypothetical protein n=1 Tax=Gordonia sp. (in: high G+C Gram-positive bacteria) TaxID=84139 RepID=UPI0039E3B059
MSRPDPDRTGLPDTPDTADAPDTEPSAEAGAASSSRRFPTPRLLVPGLSWLVGTVLVTVFFGIGAWQRRWIADDGLIVLRTVKNLFAGNGPVFNAGERVEANTSTAWTYVNWFWTWVTDGQVEYVVLWVALVHSLLAIPIAMYGTARLYGRRWLPDSGSGRAAAGFTLLLPLGSIVYIALPPARDFATSGLENGLAIFWIACLWCLFLAWSRRDPARTDVAARASFLFLAFFAGLAPLIRPEITVLGALVLLVLFCAPIGWLMRVAMVVVAAVLPVGYQVFRMGYYAILVPNPAIAKDASGSKWGQGYLYLENLFSPYLLLLPVILAVLVGVVLVLTRVRDDVPDPVAGPDDAADEVEEGLPDILDPKPPRRRTVGERWKAFQASLQRPSTAVATVLAAGVLLSLYWTRQGGDFMHGRVLLAPMFILLLPVMVVPATLPDSLSSAVSRPRLAAAGFIVLVVGGTVWWGAAISQQTVTASPMEIGREGIVDERRFYVANMANPNPVTAEDYLDYPRMRAMMETIEEVRGKDGGIILPAGDFDHWYVAKLRRGLPEHLRGATTLYFLNLGMTGMNAPLDVRVVDQMGLAYPLAAHTERLQDGRIGHDKNLPNEWVVAESGGVSRGAGLPAYIEGIDVRRARAALKCPETQKRFISYKVPWDYGLFRDNLRKSLEFNSYRISRIPEYEILRCGLEPVPDTED